MNSISSYIKTGLTVAVLGGVAYGIIKAGSWVKSQVEVGVHSALVLSEFDAIHTAHPVKEDAQQAIRARVAELIGSDHTEFESTILYLLRAYDSFLNAKEASATVETATSEE